MIQREARFVCIDLPDEARSEWWYPDRDQHPQVASTWNPCRGLFYKYNPLLNRFVKNNPHQMFMPNLAWRKGQNVTRVTFRFRLWRSLLSAIGTGENRIQPLALAESLPRHVAEWRKATPCHQAGVRLCHWRKEAGDDASRWQLWPGSIPSQFLALRHAYMQMLLLYRMLWLQNQSELRMHFFCRPRLSVVADR
jgi:hypothetical protein